MDNFEPINKSYETLKYYEQILIEYLTRLYTTGLTSSDYYDINKVTSSIYQELDGAYRDFTNKYGSRHKRKEMKENLYWSEEDIKRYKLDRCHMLYYTKQLNNLLYEFKKLQELLKERLIGYTIEEFIEKETSLTHLAYTNHINNTRIRPHSKNSIMFLCSMHLEKTPSFSVDNMNRSGHCYGCGQTVNPISYLEQIEDLEPKESIELLADVYELDIPGNHKTPKRGLTDKYKASLLDPKFKELLETCLKRTEKYRLTSQVRLALDTYQRDLQTIERVRQSKPLPYSNKEDLPKRLVLESPFDHNK